MGKVKDSTITANNLIRSLILTGQASFITDISESDTFTHMCFFKRAIYHYLHTNKLIWNIPIPAESGKKSVPEKYCGQELQSGDQYLSTEKRCCEVRE